MATEHIPLPPHILEMLGHLHTEDSKRIHKIENDAPDFEILQIHLQMIELCGEVYVNVIEHIISHVKPDETVLFSFPEDHLFRDHLFGSQDFLATRILLKHPTNNVNISHEKTGDGSIILFVTLN